MVMEAKGQNVSAHVEIITVGMEKSTNNYNLLYR